MSDPDLWTDASVKAALIILGYGDGALGDPRYDPISLFQAAHDLKVTGIADHETKTEIKKALLEKGHST